MTFHEVTDLLKKLGLQSTWACLEIAVNEEAEALRKHRKLRRSCGVMAGLEEEAREYYAEDISVWLDSAAKLQPTHVLHQRRTATAWAIATLIRWHMEQSKKGE